MTAQNDLINVLYEGVNLAGCTTLNTRHDVIDLILWNDDRSRVCVNLLCRILYGLYVLGDIETIFSVHQYGEGVSGRVRNVGTG